MSVSVAIATYNRAEMVREALHGALGQTIVPDEIIVSDDASTDATWEILSEVARMNPRVKPIRQATNTGGVENWNAAMTATSGDYIAWCSDDDVFEKGHLEASIAFLQSHPEVGMVHSGFADRIELRGQAPEIVQRPLRSLLPLTLDPSGLFLYLMRYYNWPFHPSTLVMRREVWKETGPFDSSYALADTDWFVRAASRYRICLLPRRGVYNRRHPGNWSNRLGSARMQAEIFAIVEGALERRWPGPSLKRSIWRAAWRATVRVHLLLTFVARLRTGHGDAARVTWRTLSQHTGWKLPEAVSRFGDGWVAWAARRGKPSGTDARGQVSPL